MSTPMRLYSLPLTRPFRGTTLPARQQLVYYYALMPPKPKKDKAGVAQKPTLVQRGMTFATKTWSDWGKAEGGWKVRCADGLPSNDGMLTSSCL